MPLRTLRIKGDDPDPAALSLAAAALRAGELVIYPTDTLYALGAQASSPLAVERVRTAKGREAGKALPLVASDAAQAATLSASWPAAARVLAGRFWPGPLTLVVPAAPALPAEVTAGTGSVAVRVPGLATARRLCALAGPLVSTSANVAGGVAPSTCDEAVTALGEAVSLALDAGPGGRTPSTIVDVTGSIPRLLRPGAVPWREVEEALRNASY